MIRRLAMAALAIGLLGCGAKVPPPTFTSAWPDKAGDYRLIHRSWTRSGIIWDMFDKALEVHATFMSPEWRAARVERRTHYSRLTPHQRAEMEAAETKADAAFYEVQLLVSTWDHRENDLARDERSVWKVVILDDRGNEIPVEDIDKDRRPRETLFEEFPDLNDFAIAYVARFPRTVDLYAGRSFRLRISGPRGAVDLVWSR
jgi:hypothetical protein